MPLAAWRENSSRHVASLRRIRLLFFIAPVSSTITGRGYPQWTDLRKYVAELPVTLKQQLIEPEFTQVPLDGFDDWVRGRAERLAVKGNALLQDLRHSG